MRAESPDFSKLMRPWAAAWGLPGFETGIRVRFSSRLKRSLGRCWPQRGEILLHRTLQRAAHADVAKVVCHEAAHIAAYHLYGRSVKPHGVEWAALVRFAGFNPVTRAHSVDASGRVGVRQLRRSFVAITNRQRVVVHRCPVCQMERIARRIVSGWRCAECIAGGLDGRLATTIRPTQSP